MFCVSRKGENLGALQILSTMEAAGEAEMATKISAGLFKEIENG